MKKCQGSIDDLGTKLIEKLFTDLVLLKRMSESRTMIEYLRNKGYEKTTS